MSALGFAAIACSSVIPCLIRSVMRRCSSIVFAPKLDDVVAGRHDAVSRDDLRVRPGHVDDLLQRLDRALDAAAVADVDAGVAGRPEDVANVKHVSVPKADVAVTVRVGGRQLPDLDVLAVEMQRDRVAVRDDWQCDRRIRRRAVQAFPEARSHVVVREDVDAHFADVFVAAGVITVHVRVDQQLDKLKSNVAMRMRETDDEQVFEVAGRGELHLTILLENMRREGYEMAVGRPRVLFKEVNGGRLEPFEMLSVDVEEQNQGAIMEELGRRKGDLQDMQPDGRGRVRLEYRIPARGLIGFQGEFMTLTRGTGLMSHVFDDYGPVRMGEVGERRNGVLISQDDGDAVAYALWKLQERGRMFVSPGDKLYEGMIIGINSRENDLVVNPVREKKLTNVRASGKDEHIDLVTPIALTLESAVEFIADDELVEITPHSIRLRKRYLKEHERKRAQREAA